MSKLNLIQTEKSGIFRDIESNSLIIKDEVARNEIKERNAEKKKVQDEINKIKKNVEDMQNMVTKELSELKTLIMNSFASTKL